MRGRVYNKNSQEQHRPLIGVMLPGLNAAEIFLANAESLRDFDFLVYIPSINTKLRKSLERAGVRFTTEIAFFILNSAHFDAGMTFGCLPHVAHRNVLLLTAMMREIGVPVIDIQHGLYQWGINFTDDSREVGFSGTSGISLPISTMADLQITWTGENAVGYPRYKKIFHPAPKPHGPILIATNTNWHIYTNEDRYRLLRMFSELFASLPRTRFVWKPHPAEFNPANSILREMIKEIQEKPQTFPNVTIVGGGATEQATLTELIGDCRAGIATIGTAVIDFEMLHKPCAIFDCPAVSELNGDLVYADTFRTFNQLIAWINNLDEETKAPVTGQLKLFDPSALAHHMKEAISAADARQRTAKNLLPILIRYQKLAS